MIKQNSLREKIIIKTIIPFQTRENQPNPYQTKFTWSNFTYTNKNLNIELKKVKIKSFHQNASSFNLSKQILTNQTHKNKQYRINSHNKMQGQPY